MFKSAILATILWMSLIVECTTYEGFFVEALSHEKPLVLVKGANLLKEKKSLPDYWPPTSRKYAFKKSGTWRKYAGLALSKGYLCQQSKKPKSNTAT